ncbi:hypothetical protein F3Y22_tig00112523pilonHSYRG00014 [Hibiscus syriacus]|uniref:Uncharacterized protein n=1 Tax=Hibiscus syriacus TaxID=106335 RepID=A0A6A2XFA7_HIBSY|nr:hypothetical protein F3Y22_tig00112523pilonHSYRG00014 [Hibiscus syriacus]
MSEVFDIYKKRASGQKVNYTKSNIYFGPSTPVNIGLSLSSILGVIVVSDRVTYLCMPLVIGQNCSAAFGFFRDKLSSRIRGWTKNTYGGQTLQASYIDSTVAPIRLGEFMIDGEARWNMELVRQVFHYANADTVLNCPIAPVWSDILIWAGHSSALPVGRRRYLAGIVDGRCSISKPPLGFVKLNVDGACPSEERSPTIGALVRDHDEFVSVGKARGLDCPRVPSCVEAHMLCVLINEEESDKVLEVEQKYNEGLSNGANHEKKGNKRQFAEEVFVYHTQQPLASVYVMVFYLILHLQPCRISALRCAKFLTYECSFFTWFSDAQQKDDTDRIHDEVKSK